MKNKVGNEELLFQPTFSLEQHDNLGYLVGDNPRGNKLVQGLR